MKAIYFLIFTSFCYSQDIKYDRFSIENNKIIWQNVYQKDSINNIENIKSIPSLKFSSEKIASAAKQSCKCKGISAYMYSVFGFNVLVEEKQDKYRITVTDIAFETNLQYTIGSITTSNETTTLNEMELRTSDYKFRKNATSQQNMNCLDNFLIDFFKPKAKKDW